ncbi:MAG TPA: Hint domain-containing protein, partial [Bradyrhizobium sp.]
EATQLTSPNAGQTDLWSDDEHLSAAGQAIEANYDYNLVENAVPTVGETLTANPALTGTSGSTANVIYQWQSQLAGQAWTNIGGATHSTYVVQAGDLGANLRVVASFTDPTTGELAITDSPATFAVVAAPATWVPGVSGDWSTAADWTAGSVPASTDNVVFADLTTLPSTISITISSSHSAQSLTINDAGTTVVVNHTGTLSLSGALTVDAGNLFLQGGTVNAAEGIFVEGSSPGGAVGGTLLVSNDGTLTGSVVDNGTINYAITNTNSFTGSLSGDGALVLAGGGHLMLGGTDTYSGGTTIRASTLELETASAAGTGAITLAGNHATLQIDGALPADMPANTISGFVPGDIIHLENVAYDSAGSVTPDANNQLQITEGGKTYDLQLDKSEDFSGDVFHLVEAADHSTLVEASACYCPGTLILTSRGERPIEQLAIGDRLVTRSGARRRIRWIGRRSYAGRFAAGQKHILPICIKAGALEAGLPRRDLWISPQHAMYLEGVLIEAKDLTNGVSIVQADQVEKVEYFHVELETHDVIFAEGALSESFLDDGSRGIFHNAPEYHALYPDTTDVPVRYCAPRCNGGYTVAAARDRIDARAGLRHGGYVEALPLRGFVDAVANGRISGWAQNPN